MPPAGKTNRRSQPGRWVASSAVAAKEKPHRHSAPRRCGRLRIIHAPALGRRAVVPGSTPVPGVGRGVPPRRTFPTTRDQERRSLWRGGTLGKCVLAGRQNQHSGRVCSPNRVAPRFSQSGENSRVPDEKTSTPISAAQMGVKNFVRFPDLRHTGSRSENFSTIPLHHPP